MKIRARSFSVTVALLAVLLMGLSTLAVPPLNQQATGSAQLSQISGSGIRGQILFLDSGSSTNGLVVSGFATGLDPTAAYISLRYDTGSVPGGPLACEPSSPDPLTGAQMFVGAWTVNSDGTGTLFAIKSGASYTPLSAIGSISIRRVPGGVLQACGQINTNP